MPNDDRPVATDRDWSRQVTTTSDNNDYTLSIEEVSEHYAQAGHPRTIRTLQRYCVTGHLDARKVATTTGDKYFVTSQSVARHIAQIEEMRPLDTVATNRDQPRLVATPDSSESSPVADATSTATGGDTERQGATPVDASRSVATPDPGMSRYVERLEHEVEQARDERDFLREQINRKDKTIEALIERDRETNYLVRGLQEMLSPLLGPARREPPSNSQQ